MLFWTFLEMIIYGMKTGKSYVYFSFLILFNRLIYFFKDKRWLYVSQSSVSTVIQTFWRLKRGYEMKIFYFFVRKCTKNMYKCSWLLFWFWKYQPIKNQNMTLKIDTLTASTTVNCDVIRFACWSWSHKITVRLSIIQQLRIQVHLNSANRWLLGKYDWS